MSRESVFVRTLMGTGFYDLQTLQEPEVGPWRLGEMARFEIPQDSFTLNTNLHFLRLTIKNYIFWRLNFRPFDGWRLLPIETLNFLFLVKIELSL